MQGLNFTQIGQQIHEIRLNKGLTQQYIAHKTGVNVSHISNIETNKTKVSLTLLVQICNVLDTTVDTILKTEYHNPSSATEKELLNLLKNMPLEKQDALLRIAKVL